MRKFASGGLFILGISLLLLIENTTTVSAQGEAGKEQGSYETRVEPRSGGKSKDWKSFLETLPFELQGFWEARGGLRTQNDPHESKTATLGETRLQLHLYKALDWAQFRFLNYQSENFLLTFSPPHPLPLPSGERGRSLRLATRIESKPTEVRGNFKYF